MFRRIVLCLFALLSLIACTFGLPPTPVPSPTSQTEVSETPTIPAGPVPASAASGRLLYVSGEVGNQTLWLRDLANPQPTQLASGAEVYGYGYDFPGSRWIHYGVSSSVGGLFSVYLADTRGENAILLASDVESAFGMKSPDESKVLIRITRAGNQSLELLDIASGQRRSIVQSAEEVQGWFMNHGRMIAFLTTQPDGECLYVVDADLQQLPRQLASGGPIYPLSLSQSDLLVWVVYDAGSQRVETYDPVDGSVRELLRGSWVNWGQLGDSAASFTLHREDGTEQHFVFDSDGLHEVDARPTLISPDEKHVVYFKEGLSYLGTTGVQDLRAMEAMGLDIGWGKFTTDSQRLVYMGYASDQTEFAIFSTPSFGGEIHELARFTAPEGSSDPSHGLTTMSSGPSGWMVETSTNTATGGFALSPTGDSVVMNWSWLTGDRAGTHQLVRVRVDGTNRLLLSEGPGLLRVWPRFTPDGSTVFAIVEGSDGLQELRVYGEDDGGTVLISGAADISYEFTHDTRSAVLGVSGASVGEGIYILDLPTLNTQRIGDGTSPHLLDPFSLDGEQAWQ